MQPNGAVGGRREDANSDFVHRHTCHGVFVGIWLCHTHFGTDQGVDLWIICHHGLIHSIERELVAFGAPECAFVDAKLIAVNGSTVEKFAIAVGGNLVRAPIGSGDEEVVVFGESQRARSYAEVFVCDALFEGKRPNDGLFLPIVGYDAFGGCDFGNGFVAFGEGGANEIVYFSKARGVDGGIHGLKVEKRLLGWTHAFPFVGEEQGNFFDIGLHQGISPPRGVGLSGLKIPIVSTSPHQIV